MPSHKMRSGKHPIIVRLTEQEYEAVKQAAFDYDLTPNAFMAKVSVIAALEQIEGKRKE